MLQCGQSVNTDQPTLPQFSPNAIDADRTSSFGLMLFLLVGWASRIWHSSSVSRKVMHILSFTSPHFLDSIYGLLVTHSRVCNSRSEVRIKCNENLMVGYLNSSSPQQGSTPRGLAESSLAVGKIPKLYDCCNEDCVLEIV